jgi:hypothetical protein
MFLGQVVKPLIVRHYALQCPITGIAIRLPTVEAGHRPRCDTDVVGDWDHNNAPGPLAFRTSTKFGDNQPLDLILGLRELFHGPHNHRLGSRTMPPPICGVPKDKSQGSSVATTVAGRSFRRVYGTELAGGADQFGAPLADPAVEALAGPLRSARGAGHVSSPRNQLADRASATKEKRSSKEP